jgi:hypothetical protein
LGISKYYYDNKIKEHEMDDECNTHRRDDKYKLLSANWKELNHFKDLATDGG